ncbi:DUF4926 domain-containing protein [Hamadaea sp. NPDC051192]|uniref:DUF4926 domain-containing protein n=1 Tax=Hamadaea sp. NPDC051192 TaxID=3154940 RepID=UPI003429C68A
MELFTSVRLRADRPQDGLSAGAVGAVVDVYTEPAAAYEVEFTDADGRTLALITVAPDEVEPIG